MTIEQIQEKIKKYQQTEWPLLKSRDFHVKVLPGRASIIVGARRIGKTSFMRKKISNLRESGIEADRICYLSFFDVAFSLLDYSASDIEKAYYSLYPENLKKKVYFFFDEIQIVPSWGVWISHLLDDYDCEIMITGSSAKYLSTDIATELRGRSLSTEMFPLSFCEYLDFLGIDHQGPVFSPAEQAILVKSCSQYMTVGGFPELVGCEDPEVQEAFFQDYFDLIIGRDIIDRYQIQKGLTVRTLINYMLKNNSSPLVITRLKHMLDSKGLPTALESVSSYIEMCKDARFLFEVPAFGSEKVKNRNPKKFYSLDQGLSHVYWSYGVSKGNVLEQMVFLALRRFYKDITYFKDDKNLETDFVVPLKDDRHCLIQACYNLEEAYDREVQALTSSMEIFQEPVGFIITNSEEKDIQVSLGTIKVLPLWKYLVSIERYVSCEWKI